MVDEYHLTEEEAPKAIGLADMLHGLRYELLKAQKNVAGQDPLLNLEGAEVEVKFVVKKGVKGEAGIDVHFFAVELGGKYELEEVHTLTLKLHPIKEISVAE
jgi:hypothetical protein